MNKFRSIVALTLGLLAGAQVSAHDNYNYLNITLGGGLHTLRHDPSLGSSTPGFGGTFNVNYVRYFGKHCGLGTGLGLSMYTSKSTINGMDEILKTDKYNDNQSFYYQVDYKDWKEKQNSLLLELPLGFYNRGDINERTTFMIGIGGKLTFPVRYHYEVVDGSLETYGYYPKTNATLSDMPHHGFGVDKGRYEGKNDPRIGFAVYLDFGMNHWLSEKAAFYWGVYCNYGITDQFKNHNVSLYDVNYETLDASYAGVHHSNLVDKTSLLAAGVKLGVAFAFGKKPEEPIKDTVLVKDTINLQDQLILVQPDTLAEDSSWVDVAKMIDALPNWDRFNYLNKDALEAATAAFSALSDSAKNEIPVATREKLLGLNVNVAKSTIPNLESSLKIKSSYGFNFASSDGHFTDEEKSYMQFVADCLKMNPEAKISVIGYTCNLGTEAWNEVYGFDRAIHIKNYLVRYGALEDQIEMDTKTFHNPIAPNNSEANRAKNRRTEIKLIK